MNITTMAVVGIIVSIAVLIAMSVVVQHWQQTLHDGSDVVQCQQAAALSSGLRINNREIVEFHCPISEHTVTYSSLKEPRNKSLDSFMWDQLRTCYAKVLDGRSPLFDRYTRFAQNTLEGQKPRTFCAVCSIVTFDEKIQNEFAKGTISELVTRKVQGTDLILPEYMGTQHTAKTLSGIDPTYRTNVSQAVIYIRTNAIAPVTWRTIFDATITQGLHAGIEEAVGSAVELTYRKALEADDQVKAINGIGFLTLPVRLFYEYSVDDLPSVETQQDIEELVIIDWSTDENSQRVISSMCDDFNNGMYLT